jgi:hypothetical protein
MQFHIFSRNLKTRERLTLPQNRLFYHPIIGRHSGKVLKQFLFFSGKEQRGKKKEKTNMPITE